MATIKDPVRPARPWNELIRDSRSRGTRIKRRRRMLATAPAAVLALLLGAALLTGDEATQRLRTDRHRIQIPTDPAPPEHLPQPQTPRVGTTPGAPGADVSLGARGPSVGGGDLPAREAFSAIAPGLAPSDLVAFYMMNDASNQVAVVRGDGSGMRTLTAPPGNSRVPVFSPDGKKIAYVSSRSTYFQHFDREVFELWVMNSDGSGGRRVTPALGGYNGSYWPTWSPNGKKIAFVDAPSGENNADIYVVNIDGTGLRNLTKTPRVNEGRLAWGPDGRIAVGVSGAGVEVMNADGSNRHQIAAKASDAAWSPDGRLIVFSRNYTIEVSDPDGSHVRPVISGDFAAQPVFTADSKHLVYVRDTDGTHDSYLLTPAGLAGVTGGPKPSVLHVVGLDGKDDRVLATPAGTDNYLYPSVRPRP